MKEKHSLFVLYNIKKYFCHLQRLTNLNIQENATTVLMAQFQVKGSLQLTIALCIAPLHGTTIR